jgi:hypothetical protein
MGGPAVSNGQTGPQHTAQPGARSCRRSAASSTDQLLAGCQLQCSWEESGRLTQPCCIPSLSWTSTCFVSTTVHALGHGPGSCCSCWRSLAVQPTSQTICVSARFLFQQVPKHGRHLQTPNLIHPSSSHKPTVRCYCSRYSIAALHQPQCIVCGAQRHAPSWQAHQ